MEKSTRLKSLHREAPEIKWNVHSKFGSPSVCIGYSFEKKVEVAHAAHNTYSDEKIQESIEVFHE